MAATPLRAAASILPCGTWLVAKPAKGIESRTTNSKTGTRRRERFLRSWATASLFEWLWAIAEFIDDSMR